MYEKEKDFKISRNIKKIKKKITREKFKKKRKYFACNFLSEFPKGKCLQIYLHLDQVPWLGKNVTRSTKSFIEGRKPTKTTY